MNSNDFICNYSPLYEVHRSECYKDSKALSFDCKRKRGSLFYSLESSNASLGRVG